MLVARCRDVTGFGSQAESDGDADIPELRRDAAQHDREGARVLGPLGRSRDFLRRGLPEEREQLRCAPFDRKGRNPYQNSLFCCRAIASSVKFQHGLGAAGNHT